MMVYAVLVMLRHLHAAITILFSRRLSSAAGLPQCC